MKSKRVALIMAFVMLAGLIVLPASAAFQPLVDYGPPENPGVVFEYTSPDNWEFIVGCAASSEIRTMLEAEYDGSFEEAGYCDLGIHIEVDYKLDGERWASSYREIYSNNAFDYESGIFTARGFLYEFDFEEYFPDYTLPGGKSYFDNHVMHFRVRFCITFHDDNDYEYYSPWSETVSYSNLQVEDPEKLINHAPVMKTAEIKYYEDEPYIYIATEKAHVDVQKLENISNEGLTLNIWLKVAPGDWKDCGSYGQLQEAFSVELDDYFNSGSTVFEEAIYEIKMRYEFDLDYYPTAGKTGYIYSPFSNTIKQGTPFYSNASTWSTEYLDQADELGIITGRMESADMTKPITREEFAEIAVKFYEMVTGKTAAPAAVNPFKDCSNPEVLKAYNLKVTAGTGDGTTFEPNATLIRQQMATMITNTLRACYSGFSLDSYDLSSQKDFADQSGIAAYAVKPTKFMAKYGITTVSNNMFGPNDTCTREQAIIFLVKAYLLSNQYL